ncbi:nuclear transport factor 2 family protein [Mycolicibacterium mengxianglii]|uniref:nuclear transport factor 2 family protein n=1 Tax=Mycolicibacterium mengxianglii TaxID=2736649 RepID=UPI0018D1060F|nr:nuclear transport factor 2 family protein [Mycolicibacterium mengxianglii]
MSTSEIATVLAWHDALNAKDLATLVDLSSDDIEIGDAHGAAQGLEALQEWAQGLTGTVTTGRLYVHDGVVVVEQTAGEQTWASAFRVVHDKVTSVFRHPDLASALRATDLTEDDLDA